ncbi:potassium channel family protein [Streptacidiphilus jiangxiensis]|uniref:Voltage-gated potassium channel n=1 Tax=Streptacidiphilus jiangxiensis TaxID=235985 RepID=A0A1H7SRF9_STRJI|nr:potassium channel family protein [Streptacidiphilus jiangxiensis]SEL74474.1 voltage-gated potassium channel [Streptacidiphilus jiangxiensis]
MFDPLRAADEPSVPPPDSPPPPPDEQVDQGHRFTRWNRATQVPLLVLGCAFLVLMLVPAFDSTLSRDQLGVVWAAEGVIWLVFCVDYAVKFWLAQYRRDFFRSHRLDLVMVALPMFRPLGALRVVGVFALMARGLRRNRSLLAATYTGGVFVTVLIVGAYTEWLAERNAPGADILTFGESLWWALVTIATVGYGDYVPVTTAGRLIASVLMISGIATLSMVTASVASWLVQLSRREDDQVSKEEERDRQVEQFHTLLHEVKQLNERLERLERRWDARQSEQ